MLIQEIIRIKRDRGTLDQAQIDTYIKAVTDKVASEGQIAAMCMAILLNGLTMPERVALTRAMARSGSVMDWSAEKLNGPVLDKHSTGGVGDKVSLVLAPLIAAAGGFVPMISGRGLGHTGGTLDKMDAIPGYVSQPDTALLKKTVRDVGCAVVGATADIAPADRTIYAVRDVTATVESLDLISASILSKKLAAGLQGLVMDVKFGTGSFLVDYGRMKALAQSIVSIAGGAGLPTVALMTDMNQVLGDTAGNAIEVREAIACLRGDKTEPRFLEVTLALCDELLVLGKLASNVKEARALNEKNLKSGKAAEIFARMVAALGGPADIMEQTDKFLPLAPLVLPVYSDKTGTITAMDVRAMGIAVIELGGGRRVAADKIDHGVGLSAVKGLGETVAPGKTPLCLIHARDDATAQKAAATIRAAITLDGEKTQTALVAEKITA